MTGGVSRGVQKSDGKGGMVVKRVKADGAAALTGSLQVLL